MKKFVFLFSLLCSVLWVRAEDIQYETLYNIPYYTESQSQTDAYQKERCVVDIYYPKNAKSFATVVWFHGGGLEGGSKELPAELKNQGLCVVGVNYRLSPKAKSPAYIEDAAAAVAWTFRNIASYGGDPGLIFLSGHSAGGYLISMVGLDKRWLSVYGIDANQIAGLIPFSGQMITHFTIRKERGIADTTPLVDDLAPLYHVRSDAPPLLLLTGDREMEMLGRYEENAYLYRMMKIVGHKQTILYEFQGYGHDMRLPAFPLLIQEVRKISKEKGKI